MTQEFDPYMRIVLFFDQDATAGSFLREDGEGGFTGAAFRMAREIDRLRALVASPKREEPFGYWVEHPLAEPALLRPPAYIPSGGKYKTTALYASPPSPVDTDAIIERCAQVADDHAETWGLANGTPATVVADAIRALKGTIK